MIERNERVRVAPDRNLIRNPTTRSYPTALEEMRGGQVVILPSVDARMKRRIPAAERSCADRIFSKKGSLGAGMLRSLKRELAKAAGAWREDRSSRRFQFTLRSGERGRAFRMRGTDMQPSRTGTGKTSGSAHRHGFTPQAFSAAGIGSRSSPKNCAGILNTGRRSQGCGGARWRKLRWRMSSAQQFQGNGVLESDSSAPAMRAVSHETGRA